MFHPDLQKKAHEVDPEVIEEEVASEAEIDTMVGDMPHPDMMFGKKKHV